MSENPPRPSKPTPEAVAEAKVRSDRNKEAALGVQQRVVQKRVEQVQRRVARYDEYVKRQEVYDREKRKEDYDARRAYKATEERSTNEFLDEQNVKAARVQEVKNRLIRRRNAKELVEPIIEKKKAMAAKLRQAAGSAMSRDARPQEFLKQAAVLDEEVAALEQELRDSVPDVLKPGSRNAKESTVTTVPPYSADEGSPAVVAAPEARSGLSAVTELETVDAELRELTTRFGLTETTAAERDGLKGRMKELMARRDVLRAPAATIDSEPQTIEYDQVDEFQGNDRFPLADMQRGLSEREERKELTPQEKADRAMGENEDGQPIFGLNHVLTRQAMGGSLKKLKKPEFPAAAGVAGTAFVERQEKKLERERWNRSVPRWVAGLGGMAVAAWLLALGGDDKNDVVKPVKKEGPAPAASTMPKAGTAAYTPDALNRVSVPSAPAEAKPTIERRATTFDKAIVKAAYNRVISDDDAKLIMGWQHMAYREGKQALPPKSDEHILDVLAVIKKNPKDPYAFKDVSFTKKTADINVSSSMKRSYTMPISPSTSSLPEQAPPLSGVVPIEEYMRNNGPR